MDLYLIRHTSVGLEAGICYGRSDISLSRNFEAEAVMVRRQLPPPPWRLVSSPATRCLALANYLGGPVHSDPRLAELDFGTWELRRWEDIPRHESDPWSADFVNRAPPGGESFSMLSRRAEACIAELAARHPEEKVLCVTHAGVIRAIRARREGLPLREAFTLGVSFGGVYRIPVVGV